MPLLGASLQHGNTAHISSKAAPAKSGRFVRDGSDVKGRVDDACVHPLAAVNTVYCGQSGRAPITNIT